MSSLCLCTNIHEYVYTFIGTLMPPRANIPQHITNSSNLSIIPAIPRGHRRQLARYYSRYLFRKKSEGAVWSRTNNMSHNNLN